MTNIGAIKVNEKQADGSNKEYLVFVADGMSSIPTNGTKGDNYQKLFHIDNYLLMGTGRSDQIQDTAARLSTDHFPSAEKVARAVLQVTHNYGLTKHDGLNFIVGGKDPEGLTIYHVNTTGNYKQYGGKADYRMRNYFKTNGIFDGSGSRFVIRYNEGCIDAGKELRADDTADGIVLIYDYAKKGATDAGVNDKLQYGIISDKGVSTLYHPDISFIDDPTLVRYIDEMCGTNLKVPIEELSKKERELIYNKSHDLKKILNAFYRSLNSDLKDYSNERRKFTYFAEKWGNTPAGNNEGITDEEIQKHKADRLKAKAIVAVGVDALINRGLDSILEYQHDFDNRKNQIEQRALEYVSHLSTPSQPTGQPQ